MLIYTILCHFYDVCVCANSTVIFLLYFARMIVIETTKHADTFSLQENNMQNHVLTLISFFAGWQYDLRPIRDMESSLYGRK